MRWRKKGWKTWAAFYPVLLMRKQRLCRFLSRAPDMTCPVKSGYNAVAVTGAANTASTSTPLPGPWGGYSHTWAW